MNITDERETLCAMTLAKLGYYNQAAVRQLYELAGSASEVLAHSKDITAVLPDASPRLKEMLADSDVMMRRAEEEMAFVKKYDIQVLHLAHHDYPRRLKECADAPLALYYRGTADLNQTRVINIVGTRRSTPYGEDLIRQFITDLQQWCPQVLVVSGLAYGVDICAHRQALEKGMETVGVLAHGLDDLYPSRHRNTAKQMVTHGGLITEFMTHTNADKINFVRRNRIVAGMSDACILVESAAHGGGLITADISRSYDRDVFAFPGRVGDPYSEGCNNLIRDNGAMLITGALDFVRHMGWENDDTLSRARHEGIERQLFPDLTPDEQAVVGALQQHNDLQVNMLATQSGVPLSRLTSVLFELEMKGIVRTLAGGIYHLYKSS
ncbi:MAG: DNA-processing protein DprA [Prevotella sp.]|nr:DNA-processing protein DprA [Prevotella sp.]